MTLAALVSESPRARLRALRELPATDDARFALRRVLFTDAHAEVRAAAARRLGTFAGVEAWLLDALGDGSPLVRDALLRALARAGTTAAAPALRALIATDATWWIRRDAIYALAAIAGEGEIATFTAALADPFWRVRHAAVKVLAVLGAAHPEIREDVIAAPPSSTLAFLRGQWGPVAIEAPQRAAAASELPPALLDPDPAVVTARLAAGTYDPHALVELLCDPHVPLRVLAARRIAASRDRRALVAALDWLEEPRIPHVVDTVRRLLDGLGDLAHELAADALARRDRPGATRWAIEWTVAAHAETLFEAAIARAHAEPGLRDAAIRIAREDELVAWLAPDLVDAIALELHARRRPAAYAALLALDASAHPRARALQTDVHARRGAWERVEAALADPHHGPRAVATRWIVRRDPARAGELVRDPDPAVREAALVGDVASAVLADERDPWVRRAAIAKLAETGRGVHSAPVAALADPDPWIRARACTLPIVDDRGLTGVLAALADDDEAVRAAADDAIAQLAGADARVRDLLARTGTDAAELALAPAARAAAHAWIGRALDTAAADAARAALAGEADPRVQRTLASIVGIELPAPVAPRIEPVAAPPPVAAIARRGFGRAGFDVAPLAISGAYDVSPRALAAADEAGVDLYFWEPGYDALGRFLRARARRDRSRVITGSYHAEAPAIRADVDRALRQLRRETLDVFLLFWTRSPARLDAEAFGLLDELRRAGKIRAVGFSTHHRDLAREAIATTPWDVVMTRHSAAHPGIETALLPTARATDTAILTFSALCYGRMLSGPNAPSASECYRYSLAQPGVTACISAPRRYRELAENLDVLADPTLPAARIEELRAHGRAVHAESARFNTLVRQPTRDAAAAARELLAAELPPSDAEATARPMPRASTAARSRTRLGSRRSR